MCLCMHVYKNNRQEFNASTTVYLAKHNYLHNTIILNRFDTSLGWLDNMIVLSQFLKLKMRMLFGMLSLTVELTKQIKLKSRSH